MNCPFCGEELSDEMIELDCCYSCGKALSAPTLPQVFSDDNGIAVSNEELSRRESNLRALGGYYEYKVLSIDDKWLGQANISKIENTLNQLGREGWELVTSYTNELGKDSFGAGVAGAIIGMNSTRDETILIFKRKVFTSNS